MNSACEAEGELQKRRENEWINEYMGRKYKKNDRRMYKKQGRMQMRTVSEKQARMATWRGGMDRREDGQSTQGWEVGLVSATGK